MQECIRRRIEVGEFYINKSFDFIYARVDYTLRSGNHTWIIFTLFNLKDNSGRRYSWTDEWFDKDYKLSSYQDLLNSKYGSKYRIIHKREKELFKTIKKKCTEMDIKKCDIKEIEFSFDADESRGKSFTSLKTFDWAMTVYNGNSSNYFKFSYLCNDGEERGKVRYRKAVPMKQNDDGIYINFLSPNYGYTKLYPISDFTDDEEDYFFSESYDEIKNIYNKKYEVLGKKILKSITKLKGNIGLCDIDIDNLEITDWNTKEITDEESLRKVEWSMRIKETCKGKTYWISLFHKKGSKQIEEKYYNAGPLYEGFEYRTFSIDEFMGHCCISPYKNSLKKLEGRILFKDLLIKMIVKLEGKKLGLEKGFEVDDWNFNEEYSYNPYDIDNLFNGEWRLRLLTKDRVIFVGQGFLGNYYIRVSAYERRKKEDGDWRTGKCLFEYCLNSWDVIRKYTIKSKKYYKIEVA